MVTALKAHLFGSDEEGLLGWSDWDPGTVATSDDEDIISSIYKHSCGRVL